MYICSSYKAASGNAIIRRGNIIAARPQITTGPYEDDNKGILLILLTWPLAIEMERLENMSLSGGPKSQFSDAYDYLLQ